MSALSVRRCGDVRLMPDASRVITKPFLPGEEVFPDGTSRIGLVVRRIVEMDETAVRATLRLVYEEFEGRHGALEDVLLTNYEVVASRVEIG